MGRDHARRVTLVTSPAPARARRRRPRTTDRGPASGRPLVWTGVWTAARAGERIRRQIAQGFCQCRGAAPSFPGRCAIRYSRHSLPVVPPVPRAGSAHTLHAEHAPTRKNEYHRAIPRATEHIEPMGDHRAARRAPRRRPSTASVTPARRASVEAVRGCSGGPVTATAELPAVAAAPTPVTRPAAPSTPPRHRAGPAQGRRAAPSPPSPACVSPRSPSSPASPRWRSPPAAPCSVSPAESASDGGFVRASAMSGASGTASANLARRTAAQVVSRDSRRDAAQDAAAADLLAQAEAQAKQRTATLSQFAQQAEKQAAKLKLNAWVLPVDVVQITAEFGEYGLWAQLPHRPRLQRRGRRPDLRHRRRHRHLRGVRRVLRQQDRDHAR